MNQKYWTKNIKAILDKNAELKEKYRTMESNYNTELQDETEKIRNKYGKQISSLEKENNFLKKFIHTLQKLLKNLFIEFALSFLYHKKMS